MRNTFLTVLGTALIVASTVQMTAAAEHHHARKINKTTERFRNANDAVAGPSAVQQDLSNYSEGHVISAPAGR